jgi:hypothetical protein
LRRRLNGDRPLFQILGSRIDRFQDAANKKGADEEVPEGETGKDRPLPETESVASPQVVVRPAPAKNYTFPGDRKYTHNSLVEELALAERHCRDGSWAYCQCNPEKHLPLIAGLASEGVGFAESEPEKSFMKGLRDYARKLKVDIERGDFNDDAAEDFREWAREMRHRITLNQWYGAMADPDCPTCDLSEQIRERLL